MIKKDAIGFKREPGTWNFSKSEYTNRGGKFTEELTDRYFDDFSVALGWDKEGNRVERIYNAKGKLVEDRILSENGTYDVLKYDKEGKLEKLERFDNFEHELQYRAYLDGSLDKKIRSKEFHKYGPKVRVTKDANGRFVETEIEQDEETIERIYDKKGKVKETINTYKEAKSGQTTIKKYDASNTVVETKLKFYDREKGKMVTVVLDGNEDGKLIKKTVDIRFQGKNVSMEPTRGFFSRLRGRLLGQKGDKGGKVVYSYPSSSRKTVNDRLTEILNDGSMSRTRKKTKLRETIAQFREEHGYEAPNKKVGAALKKYLPPKKEGER